MRFTNWPNTRSSSWGRFTRKLQRRISKRTHKNEVIYRTRDEETDYKLDTLLKQTEDLYLVASSASEKGTTSKAFSILSRFIKEQTNPTEDGRLIPKPGKEISPQSLQNPTDRIATYRWKHGGHTGYVGNILNAYGQNVVTTHFDLEPNTYSDQKFADETIGFLASGNPPDDTATDVEKIRLKH